MERVSPLFACKSLNKLLDFYQAIGFEVIYQQKKPYVYGVVTYGTLQVHFSRQASPSICLVYIADLALQHQTFAEALRQQYGRIPTAHQPRITRLTYGQTRFHLVDPMGNQLVYRSQSEQNGFFAADLPLSPLAQAIKESVFARDVYADDRMAIKTLDLALSQYAATAIPIEYARALAMRAELAIAMGEMELAQVLEGYIAKIPLSDEERIAYADEFQAPQRLMQWLAHKG